MDYKNYLPLTDIDQDKLNFKELSIEIADFINAFPSDIPFSISLNGSWGSGKSTMLNFIEENLEREKCDIIRFNPWLVTSRGDLILSIFEEINEKITNNFDKAKEKLKNYSLKFIPSIVRNVTYFESMRQGLDPSTSSFIANSASEFMNGVNGGGDKPFEKPLSVQKKELEVELQKVLSENNKKIVIFIDELDRLFPEEIITVFQMVKAVLDFPGLLFVVAMDDEVVKNALSKKGIESPADYLEKIFQKNYNLSSKYQIRTLTKSYIYPKLDLENECHRHLKKCLDAYIMGHYNLQIKDFTHDQSLVLENCQTKEDREVDWRLKTNVKRGSLMGSYQDLFKELSNSLKLDNPRRFGKFSSYILENWPKLYKRIFDERSTKDLYLYCTFVLLVTNYFYPEYISAEYLDKKFDKGESDVNMPIFIQAVRNHLELIFPEYYSPRNNTLKTTEFIYKCCNKIVSYPDSGKVFY